jgi:uncharacterized protein (DUF58 family)
MTPEEIRKRVRRIVLASSKLAREVFAGSYRSAFKGTGIEFEEVREYTENDDIRSVDWNVSARMGGLYTKKYREERELPVFIIFDVSNSMFFGTGASTKVESAAYIASLLATAAIMNNDRVGAVFFGRHIQRWINPAKGRKHIARLIQELFTWEPREEGSNLEEAIRGVYETVDRRGLCVVLSDFKTRTDFSVLNILGRKQDLILCRLEDPAEREFPPVGFIELADSETGTRYAASGLSEGFRKNFSEYWERYFTEWERLCRASRIEFFSVSTENDPFRAVMEFFRRRRSA